MAIKDLIFLKQRKAAAVLDYMELIYNADDVSFFLEEVGPGGVSVDWGDGTPLDPYAAGTNMYTSHYYGVSGTYTIRIYGDLRWFKAISGNKLQAVTKFNSAMTTMEGSFAQQGAAFTMPAVLPASVTSTRQMFESSGNFNADISTWDMSSVTDAVSMFNLAQSFNQNIGSWDVSSLADVDNMFGEATAFNQDLSSWITALTAQPGSFAFLANPAWVAAQATKFPFLADGVTRINA